ncbi:MAG: hypothetical protein ACRDCM_12100, partial [Plesiomonas shigelloides]
WLITKRNKRGIKKGRQRTASKKEWEIRVAMGGKKTGRLHQQTPCSRIERDGIVRDNGAYRD